MKMDKQIIKELNESIDSLYDALNGTNDAMKWIEDQIEAEFWDYHKMKQIEELGNELSKGIHYIHEVVNSLKVLEDRLNRQNEKEKSNES